MDIATLLIQSVLLAVGLAMDAFAVSISNGLAMKKIVLRHAIAIAASFGIFQAVMPLLGFLLGSSFADFIAQWDHYIALIFLGFIGGKMIYEGIQELRGKGEDKEKNGEYKFSFATLMFQAVATSIDALVVGVSFVAMKMTVLDMIIAILIIGGLTFVISMIGIFAGKRFGELLGSRAVIAGGIILVGIGLKVFIEHMFFGG
ncbi:MAG: manganese efflux pump [Eubacterium sp.]|nr:manganese efflux pump [Eubacterium sp.]